MDKIQLNMLNNIIKLIIISLCFKHLYHSIKYYGLNLGIYNISIKEKYNFKQCEHIYEYSKIEKIPTEEEEGYKIFICKYCRNKLLKKIPKLDKKNYFIEKLTSNCENGNGIRYFIRQSEIN